MQAMVIQLLQQTTYSLRSSQLVQFLYYRPLIYSWYVYNEPRGNACNWLLNLQPVLGSKYSQLSRNKNIAFINKKVRCRWRTRTMRCIKANGKISK